MQINHFEINGVSRTSFLTGDINGETQVWDPLPSTAVSPSSPTWTIVESPNPTTWEPQEP